MESEEGFYGIVTQIYKSMGGKMGSTDFGLEQYSDPYGDLAFEVYGPESLGTEGYAVNFLKAFFESVPVSQGYLREWTEDYGGHWSSIEDLGDDEGQGAVSGGAIFPTHESYEKAIQDLLTNFPGKFEKGVPDEDPYISLGVHIGDKIKSINSGTIYEVVPPLALNTLGLPSYVRGKGPDGHHYGLYPGEFEKWV